MKKIILSIVAVAFAVAVQAGETKKAADSKGQSACCAEKATSQTKATCTSEKGKVACSGKEAPSKRVLLSPKAAAEIGR